MTFEERVSVWSDVHWSKIDSETEVTAAREMTLKFLQWSKAEVPISWTDARFGCARELHPEKA